MAIERHRTFYFKYYHDDVSPIRILHDRYLWKDPYTTICYCSSFLFDHYVNTSILKKIMKKYKDYGKKCEHKLLEKDSQRSDVDTPGRYLRRNDRIL